MTSKLSSRSTTTTTTVSSKPKTPRWSTRALVEEKLNAPVRLLNALHFVGGQTTETSSDDRNVLFPEANQVLASRYGLPATSVSIDEDSSLLPRPSAPYGILPA